MQPDSELRASRGLLEPDEPEPVEFIPGASTSAYLLTCDHAGRRLPRALGNLGLSEGELQMHIAWDIGAAAVTRQLAQQLEACAFLQRYSRLVIDCNRPLGVASSIAPQSEHVQIPGNQAVSELDARLRAQAVFEPYHARIEQELERRARAGQPTILVSMHSFTPCFMGVDRPWHAGVLYNRDPRLARPLLQLLRAEPGLEVGDNQPYAVSDQSDYGVVQYGERRGLLHVEVEVRQDLIGEQAGQSEWAQRFARLLPQAVRLCAGA